MGLAHFTIDRMSTVESRIRWEAEKRRKLWCRYAVKGLVGTSK